jgi:hypothetical protein
MSELTIVDERLTRDRAQQWVTGFIYGFICMVSVLLFTHFMVQRLPPKAHSVNWVDMRLQSVDDLSGTDTVSIRVLDVEPAAVSTQYFPGSGGFTNISSEYYIGVTADGGFIIQSNSPMHRGPQTISGILGKSLEIGDKFDSRLLPHTIDTDSWKTWSVWWVIPSAVGAIVCGAGAITQMRIVSQPARSRRLRKRAHQTTPYRSSPKW